MAKKRNPVDIINEIMPIKELIKDETGARTTYAKIATALLAEGYTAEAAKFQGMSRDEGRHAGIEQDIVKANKAKSTNKASSSKFVKLVKIADEDDALDWLARQSGTDIESLEEQQESEGQEDDENYIKNQLADTMKGFRFKTLDSMIGFYDVVTEELDVPKGFPSSPFDNAGNLLRGWKKQVVPVLNIVSGHRQDTTLTAYVKDTYALVEKKEFQAGLHKI